MYTNNEKFEIYQTEINFKNNKTSVSMRVTHKYMHGNCLTRYSAMQLFVHNEMITHINSYHAEECLLNTSF